MIIRGSRRLFEHPAAKRTSERTASVAPPWSLTAAALCVAGLVFLPLGYLVLRASQAGDQVWELFFRDRTLEVLINTIVLAIAVGLTAAAIAIPAAWLTVRTDMPLGRWLAPACALPLVIPSYVGGLTFVAALGPGGYFSDWLDTTLGIRSYPSIYGFWGAWLTLSLFTFPYVFLTAGAALRGIDPVHEEAARSLGKGPIGAFMSTTLRQLRPAAISGMLLAALYAVSDFGVVTLFRYDSLTRAIYVQYRSSFDRSYAAVLSLVLVGFALVLVLIDARLRDRAAYYRIGSGVARRRKPTQLGWMRYPALVLGLMMLALSLAVPIGVLAAWMYRAIERGDDFSGLLSLTVNSLMLGAGSGLLAVIAALPVAILAARYRSRIGRAAERITYLGYGLPGIVIALSFVFLGANYLLPFYQTVPLLLLAYVVRFVPQAVGSTKSSLLQINPHIEDAARGLGKQWKSAVWSVTAPLAFPGILVGFSLVFMTVVKELPITLLLRPTGMDTLATDVWTAAGSGAYGRAAAPALALIALSAIPSILVLGRMRDIDVRGEG
ncbi:iron ABC transporter permease [soil metagenome]